MMNIVTTNNLSQDNISCLNTSLIVLMLANMKNQLPKYLKAIRKKSDEMTLASNDSITANRQPNTSRVLASQNQPAIINTFTQINLPPPRRVDIMLNFKDLLIFWQAHYLQKDKDCAGLELNSRIHFPYWKQTVELLLDTNPQNNCSLNFYLN
jgi:Trpc4-associated protein